MTKLPADSVTETSAPRRSRWTRLPVVSQLRQSVGLQRGMLVGGLSLTGIFLLTALFAPVLSPYGFSQLRGDNGAFGATQPPSSEHWLGTTQGGLDVLSRLIWGSRTALYVIVVAVIASVSEDETVEVCNRASPAMPDAASPAGFDGMALPNPPKL